MGCLSFGPFRLMLLTEGSGRIHDGSTLFNRIDEFYQMYCFFPMDSFFKAFLFSMDLRSELKKD